MILNGDWVLDAAALASSILQCQVDNPYHEETKFCIWFGSTKDWGSCWLKTCVLFSQVHLWLMMCLVDYHAKSTIDACADVGLWLYRWATCLHWSGTYQQHWKLHSGVVMSLWLGTKSMLQLLHIPRSQWPYLILFHCDVLQKVLFDEAICEENQATTALLYSISSTQVLLYMHFSSNGSFVLDSLVALKTCCLEVAQLLFIFLVCLGFDSGPPAFTRHLED